MWFRIFQDVLSVHTLNSELNITAIRLFKAADYINLDYYHRMKPTSPSPKKDTYLLCIHFKLSAIHPEQLEFPTPEKEFYIRTNSPNGDESGGEVDQ